MWGFWLVALGVVQGFRDLGLRVWRFGDMHGTGCLPGLKNQASA